jgi:hypothetical protein
LLVVQAYLYVVREPLNAEYARLTVPTLPTGSREIDFLMYTLLTLAVVLAALHVEWSKLRFGATLSFVMLLWVITQDTGTQGRYLWAQPVDQSLAAMGAPAEGNLTQRVVAAAKTEGNFYRLIHDYFDLDRIANSGELTWRGLTRGLIPNWEYQRYTRFIRRWGAEASTLNHLLGKQKLFFHTELTEDPKAFLANARAARDSASTHVSSFDGSELVVETSAEKPGYLAWIDNWDDGWSARVDGAPVKVEQLLGTFKSVRLATAGKHSVQFRYRPVISPLAYAGFGLLALVGLPFAGRLRRKAPAAAS